LTAERRLLDRWWSGHCYWHRATRGARITRGARVPAARQGVEGLPAYMRRSCGPC